MTVQPFGLKEDFPKTPSDDRRTSLIKGSTKLTHLLDNSDVVIVGHKNPDTDASCSAIGYAILKNYLSQNPTSNSTAIALDASKLKISKTNRVYIAKIAGKCNKETAYVLQRFGFNPADYEITDSNEFKRVLNKRDTVLVDHNTPKESPDGIDQANIIKIIDHHRPFLNLGRAIRIKTKPVGATCSIMAQKMLFKGIKDQNLAGLLLAAMISDTIGFTGPTTTEKDRLIASRLAAENGINLKELIDDVLKVKTDISGLTPQQLLEKDGKITPINGYNIYIGQIEIADYGQVGGMDTAFFNAMEKLKKEKKVDTVLLMQTNIVDHSTRLLVFPPYNEIVEKAFGRPANFEYGNHFILDLPNVVSRKADIIPRLDAAHKQLLEEKTTA